MSEGDEKGTTPSVARKEGANDKKKDLELLKGFTKAKHVEFILGLDKKTDTFEYHITEHLRFGKLICRRTYLHVRRMVFY